MISVDLHATLLYISHYEDPLDEDLGTAMMMISVVTKEEDWWLHLGVA